MGEADPLIFVIAGEPSGDVLGGRLMAALERRCGGRIRFAGVGGPHMEEAGLVSLFPIAELSVMGLTEVLPHLPRLIGRIRQTAAAIGKAGPAAVVTVDSPGFTYRVAKKLRRANGAAMPLIHYVAPQVWAWHPAKAKVAARIFDRLMALLPFEPPYFEAQGLPCSFVGHPVVESGADKGDGPGFRRRHGIAADAPLLAALPGSRGSEVSRLLPIFAQALARLKKSQPRLSVVLPTVEPLAETVQRAAAGWPVDAVVVVGPDERFDAFAAADAALAASGTVSLELAMAGTPTAIAYKVHPLTGWLARRLIRIPFVNLVNIILEREVVPEFLQQNCTPAKLAAALSRLLTDDEARRAQKAAFKEVLGKLGSGAVSPSDAAAEVVLSMIGRPGATRAAEPAGAV